MTESHKQLLLLSLIVFFSAVFWLSAASLLPLLAWQTSPVLWSTLISGFILVILWGLAVLLIDNSFWLILTAALMTFIGTLWFLNPIFIAAASVYFIFSVAAYYRARFILQTTMGGAMLRPLHRGVALMVTFLLATLCTGYYILHATSTVSIEGVLPESIFTELSIKLSPAIKRIDPNFNPNLTIGNYMENRLRAENPTATDSQIQTAVVASVEKYNKELGTHLTASDTYMHLIYTSGIRVITQETTAYSEYFPEAYAIVLFLTLRVLVLPLMWAAIAIALLALRFLHYLGIVEMRAIPSTILAYSFSSKQKPLL